MRSWNLSKTCNGLRTELRSFVRFERLSISVYIRRKVMNGI